MNKDKAREIFEKMRNDNPKYIQKNLSDKPTEAGTYTVSIENIRSILPITLNFDGVNWDKSGLEKVLKYANGDITKISYYQIDISKKHTI